MSNFIINGFAFLLGAFLTNLIRDWFQKRRVIQSQKAELLKELMATRFNSPNDQKAAEAINYIPVLFAGSDRVLEAFDTYYEAVVNNLTDKTTPFNKMVVAIAKDIGINLKPVDLMRIPIVSHQRKIDDASTEEQLEKLAAKQGKNANT